jgi:hypothetical protein
MSSAGVDDVGVRRVDRGDRKRIRSVYAGARFVSYSDEPCMYLYVLGRQLYAFPSTRPRGLGRRTRHQLDQRPRGV